MKSITSVIALTWVFARAVTAASKCNADNCARAVTGTLRAATSAHFSDCQSFLACTVTPATSTVTVTTTGTLAAASTTIAPGTAVTTCPSQVPTYASACSGSARYSSACSCFGASASTTTASTPTTTITVAVTPTQTSCVNKGFEWAYYAYNSSAVDFNYDPAIVKTQTPSAEGVTNYLSITAGQGVYGKGLDQTAFILNHRGYILAPETGTYSLSGARVDDITHMWVGPLAYSGWNRDNAQQILNYAGPASGTFQIDLVAGRYYPFRLVFRQYGGPLGMDYSITSPSGLVVIGSDPNSATNSPYAVKYSCDSATAPAFQPFGQET